VFTSKTKITILYITQRTEGWENERKREREKLFSFKVLQKRVQYKISVGESWQQNSFKKFPQRKSTQLNSMKKEEQQLILWGSFLL
jgi:hypothetical protein